MPIMTLGHSTHEPERFLQICRAARVEVIVDVRSHRSSKWAWWHGEQMDRWLPEAGIDSLWCENLGGWSERTTNPSEQQRAYWAARGVDLAPYCKGHFPKQRIGAKRAADQPELDGNMEWVSSWTNQGLHDYAWYTATRGFQAGLEWLVAGFGGKSQPRAAIVCSELLWWKCHRSMIADVLQYQTGIHAVHLTPTPRDVRTPVHEAVERIGRYPTAVRDIWSQQDVAVA